MEYPLCLDDKLITGRAHGGIGILWEKSLSQSTNIIKYEDTRILGLEIKCNNAILLFLCVYLPYECDMFYDDYIFYLNKIKSNCTIHCKDIDIFYNNIVAALKTSGTECIPMFHTDKYSSFRPFAGWNEYVKEHYSIAQDALWLWKYHNKPNNDAIYHNMRSSKSRFKYALRSVRKVNK